MEATLEQPLVNRVANSSLVTIDLEAWYPAGEIVPFDLKDYLFMGLILKEKDFREALLAHDWTQHQGKNLAVFCSADAIIPMWAYMLVATHAAPFVADIALCEPADFPEKAFFKKLAALNISDYEGKRLVIKGCSDKPVPASAYLEITKKLQPVALSIMFGEPCSTVPVYKKAKGG
ncbi:MAG: DUF2480 family protein [Saprospiraceae bacterium]|nr:DUF2480 family protein [Saprospiraceae bacterium]